MVKSTWLVGPAMLFSLLASFRSLQAGLEWEATKLEYHPALGAAKLDAEFKFRNRGTEPATIEYVEPTCDCVTAEADKKVYAPGESGKVHAVIAFDGVTGHIEKIIMVRVAGEPKEVMLTLAAEVPELLRVTPKALAWKIGEAAAAKCAELTVAAGRKLRLDGVTSNSAHISAKLEPVREGEAYTLSVTPDGTNTARFAILTIQSTPPAPKESPFVLYVRISKNPEEN
jgi:hypothetical protein